MIISNCVINLSPDKGQTLNEAFRVLKPGGRLAVSDIVIDGTLDDLPVSEGQVRAALKLLLLTGQRVREIVELEWNEIDMDARLIALPPSRVKTGRAHVIPVEALALDVLRGLPSFVDSSRFVFPDQTGQRPTPWRTLTRAVDRIARRFEIEPFAPRDIRRTVKTHLARIGVLQEVRNRLQNHALDDVGSKHYDRFDYLDDKRAALQGWDLEIRRALAGIPTSATWEASLRRLVREPDEPVHAERLEALLSGEPGQVIPLRRAAG